MILNGTEDLRVRKTIGAIKSAFEKLICGKDYENITVRELCEAAQINKKTFYHYYPSLDDLLAELQTEISSSYINTVRGFKLPEEIEKVNRAFFEFSCSQGTAFEKITCSSGSYDYIRRQMINRVVAETWERSESFRGLDGFTREVLLEHVNSINVNIYRRWIEDGKRVPVEKLIDLADKLTVNGIRAVI